MLQLNNCKKCKTYFPSAIDLRIHVLEQHIRVKKFKCATCSAEFKTDEKSLLMTHLATHTNCSANWTNICHGIGGKRKDAKSFEEITTISESACELCDEKFYLKCNQDVHTQCVHGRKLRCPQCKTVFTKAVVSTHEPTSAECNGCTYIYFQFFFPKFRFQCYFAHQLEHRRLDGATVTETDMNVLIDKLNASIDEQFVYNAEDTTASPYKCLICHIDWSNKSEIRSHIRLRHVYKTLPQPIKASAQQERVICNICGVAITKYSFKVHWMTHTNVKKFPCSFCGKIFSKKYSKTTHERMHTGEVSISIDFIFQSRKRLHKQLSSWFLFIWHSPSLSLKLTNIYQRL